MIVKICGIRTFAAGLAALEAGATWLGFNFYPPSPRAISPLACARLVSQLRGRGLDFQAVGVFVNTAPPDVLRILDECGLDQAQLAGDEAPSDLEALDGRAFKALRPAGLEQAGQLARSYARSGTCPALLVDAYRPGLYGGSGQVGDWSLAAHLALQVPLFLAGGLTPANVAQAVRQVRPWGVDVASGVEAEPGRKDARLMVDFVRAAQQSSQEIVK